MGYNRFVSVLVLLCCILAISTAHPAKQQEKKRYDGYQVLRFNVQSESEGHSVVNFAKNNRLDIWSKRLVIGSPFDVNVSPKFLEEAKSLGVSFSIFIEDLQKAIDEEERQQQLALPSATITPSLIRGDDDSFFTAYQQFDQIQTFLQSLAGNYSSFVQYIEIGTTIQGRPIFGVTISAPSDSTSSSGSSSGSSSSSGSGGNKPGIFFNGCQHAREWISPMTVTYILWNLVTQYNVDPNITALVNNFVFTIVPIVNGDGYVYTQTDRMWRKNRRENGGILRCVGVDNNRNWGNHWNDGGASTDPCSDEYCGKSAFSEPEESAVANYIGNHTNIQAYIDFHSYSQLWMTPWGWTKTLPADYQTQLDGANIAVKALSALYGTQYTTGSIYSTIYDASGGSSDWVYGNGNVKWSYAVELRDQGQYGFVLPPTEILPSGKETLAGVIAMAQYVQSQL